MPIRYRNTKTNREASVPTPDEAAAKVDASEAETVRQRQRQILAAMDRSTRWEVIPNAVKVTEAPETAPKRRAPSKGTSTPKKRSSSARGVLRADGTIGG